MSKSLGNFIDLELIEKYINEYSMDGLRYYLVTQGPLGATDADFAAEKFHDIYNAHLVNTVGNCASRVTAMIGKYFDGTLPTEVHGGERYTVEGFDWVSKCRDAVSGWTTFIGQFEIEKSTEIAMNLIRDVDSFINETAPFKLAKEESKQGELGAILYQCIETLRVASILLSPIIPHKMEEFHRAIGYSRDGSFEESTQWGGLKAGTTIEKVALFPRVDFG